MGQAEVTTGGSRPVSCRFNYSVLARVRVGNVVVEAQPRRRRRSERGSSKSRDKSSTRFSFDNWVPYRPLVRISTRGKSWRHRFDPLLVSKSFSPSTRVHVVPRRPFRSF